jgi:hypothetical protein
MRDCKQVHVDPPGLYCWGGARGGDLVEFLAWRRHGRASSPPPARLDSICAEHERLSWIVLVPASRDKVQDKVLEWGGAPMASGIADANHVGKGLRLWFPAGTEMRTDALGSAPGSQDELVLRHPSPSVRDAGVPCLPGEAQTHRWHERSRPGEESRETARDGDQQACSNVRRAVRMRRGMRLSFARSAHRD